MKLDPWRYLFLPFNSFNFHDLFYPIAFTSLALLVLSVVLYYIRTRQLRGHPPYLDLYEWLLWTSVITFSLLLVYAIFVFDFIFVLLTIAIGLGTLIYARFIHFPPLLAAYEAKLARQRYFSRMKYAHPESTIRARPSRRRRRR